MIDEKQMLFAISPGETRGEAPTVILGIPSAAWDHMKDGKCHTFDLTKAGIAVKLIIYGAKDHAAAMAMLNTSAGFRDMRETGDFSIPPSKK